MGTVETKGVVMNPNVGAIALTAVVGLLLPPVRFFVKVLEEDSCDG